jgi:hypothetical protein
MPRAAALGHDRSLERLGEGECSEPDVDQRPRAASVLIDPVLAQFMTGSQTPHALEAFHEVIARQPVTVARSHREEV